LEAEITLEYDNSNMAEAIVKAVSPDNFKTPKGLLIKTTRKANRVITRLNHNGKILTFIATIDDLLFCASTAEKAIQTANDLE
jgi:hypothetical protein